METALFLAQHGRIYSEFVSGLGRALIGIDQGDISKYGSEAGWVLGRFRELDWSDLVENVLFLA